MIIALCGYPHSGKSTLQDYLEARYGFVPCDDAAPIRLETMRRYGLSADDVSTQSGKDKVIDTPDRPRSIRRAMADIADEFIGAYGTQWKPQQALLAAKGLPRVCFASVRRDEARTYRDAGAIVIEITRPDCGPRTQADAYDPALAHITIENNGDLSSLFKKVDKVMEKFLPPPKPARTPKGPRP